MIRLNIAKSLISSEGILELKIDIQLPFEKVTVITGPSGGGKTSVLKMISGILNPDSGTIQVGDTTWFDSLNKINLDPIKREIGFMFQEPALFPNMSVFENLKYADNTGAMSDFIEELIDIMDLRGLRNSYPHSLSGGQRQRVSLARAMVRKPKILMLDEPLASLDSVNRTRLQDYLLELKSKHAMTIILVSHDSNEIIKMCDELIYIEQGMVSSKNTKYHFMTELPITGALVIDDLIEDSGKFICVLKWEQSKYKMELSPDQFAEFRIGDEITLRDLH